MDDLLTTAEVQDLLRIDRTTVYRMLKDGRLRAVKVGQQWRFPRAGLRGLLARPAPTEDVGGLPAHCLQTIQDLFVELSGLEAIVLDPSGAPATAAAGGELAAAQLIRHAGAAGLSECASGALFATAHVHVGGRLAARVVVGPAPAAERARLLRAARQLAAAVESVAAERARVLDRLRRIAELSSLGAEAAAE
jgi:excisionase family DNA binding protein